MATHNDLGKKGEALAIAYLIKHNYTILETNYRFKKAEVDIIARKGDILAVVEVKTRSNTYFGNPQDFVTPKKIKLLLSAINNYIDSKDLDVEVRFDIIAIVTNKTTHTLDHLKAAFLYF